MLENIFVPSSLKTKSEAAVSSELILRVPVAVEDAVERSKPIDNGNSEISPVLPLITNILDPLLLKVMPLGLVIEVSKLPT